MKIKINNIESFRSPESTNYSVDDRIERIPLINGNCVQDYGYIGSGDYFTVSAIFKKADFWSIVGLWSNRTLVTYTDDGGTVWEGMRIVIRSYQYVAKYPDYVTLNFEMWRV